MSKIEELQQKAAELPEETAAKVIDFLKFLESRKEPKAFIDRPVRGRFKGRLSSSDTFARSKAHEIAMER